MLWEEKNWFVIKYYHDIIKVNQKNKHYTKRNGLERIFVNTEIKDGTELSELMTCFLEKEVDNPNFPEFSKRMKFLKHEKGGLDAVCDVMERYEEIAAEKAEEKANIKAIKNMIQFNISKSVILTKYSETEYEQAVKELEEEEAE